MKTNIKQLRSGRVGLTLIFGIVLLFSIVISSPLAGALAAPGSSTTPTTFDWVNQAQIKASNWTLGTTTTTTITFNDSNPLDGTHTFVSTFKSGSCKPPTLVFSGSVSAYSKGTLTAYSSTTSGKPPKEKCVKTTESVTVGSTDNATKKSSGASSSGSWAYRDTKFAWTNKKTIKASGHVDDTFVKGGGSAYARSDKTSGSCHDKITPNAKDPSKGVLTIVTAGAKGACNDQNDYDVKITNTDKGPDVAGSDDDDNDTPVCESSGFSLNWVFCGIYDGLSSVSGWLLDNFIMPQLSMSPLCISSSGAGCVKDDPIYKIWSNFRIYGDIFLVIALLVVVFGQAIGGGLIDAYTAKKILPRLLLAGVLINLSIYIVAGLVDLTNIIGGGIGQIITAPLSDAKAFSIKPSGITAGGELLGAAGTAGVLGAGSLAGLGTIAGLSMVLDVILVPFFLVLVTILAVIIIRKAVIIALVFVAPVAFALYCLPNTEKYFRKWWDLLLEMLAVYPIIVLMFAISSVMSVTVMNPSANNNDASSGINYILSFVFLMLPLFLIPFSFKIASNAVGRIFDAVNGGRERVHAMGQGRRERSMQGYKNANIQARRQRSATLMDAASKGGDFRRATLGRGLGLAARTYGGYNIEARASAAQAEEAKIINDQIDNGVDSEPRALTVNRKTALAGAGIKWDKEYSNEEGAKVGAWRNASTNALMTKSDGTLMSEGEAAATSDYRDNKNGVREYKTLAGSWQSEASVIRAQKRWGNNTFAQQAALSYEMRKANTDNDRKHLIDNYESVARGDGGWGMTTDQADGSWIGASFQNQNNNLQFKYVKRNAANGRDASFDYKGYVQEVYEKRGSYAMSNMDATSIDRLTEAVDKGEVPPDQLQAIARTMQDRMTAARSGAGQVQPTGSEGAAEPTGSAMGAGHVSDAMNRFVQKALGQQSN